MLRTTYLKVWDSIASIGIISGVIILYFSEGSGNTDQYLRLACVLTGISMIIGSWISDKIGVVRNYGIWGRHIYRDKTPTRFLIDNSLRKALAGSLLLFGISWFEPMITVFMYVVAVFGIFYFVFSIFSKKFN